MDNPLDLGMSCRFFLALTATLLLLGGCATFSSPNARGYYSWSAEQCVPYARQASGIQLYGDAHTWWGQAANKYARGSYPAPGAVLVLARTPTLTHGHLAVVKDIVGPRQINVTHRNWGNGPLSRRAVYESVRVEDVSPANDWSMVKFWNKSQNSFGFPYAAMGFIYPHATPRPTDAY